jgi:hypothetical protein
VGGTFVSTLALTTPHLSIRADAAAGQATASRTNDLEGITVETAPGEVLITRDEKTDASAIQTVMLDVLVKPGDQAIDDTVLHFPALWIDANRPVPPERMHLELQPFRHVVARQMEVLIDHSFTLRRNDSKHVCAASTQATIVDHEALRQPLWDIGIASPSEGRRRFLSLYSAKLGVIRAIFSSPTEAQSFVSWISLSHAVRVGDFELGIASQSTGDVSDQSDGRSELPPSSFARLQSDVVDQLRIGPLGEP